MYHPMLNTTTTTNNNNNYYYVYDTGQKVKGSFFLYFFLLDKRLQLQKYHYCALEQGESPVKQNKINT